MVREGYPQTEFESCANESKIMGGGIPTNERVCFPSLFHVLACQMEVGGFGGVGIRAGM